MKLKPYPKYKDSGIQWIGEIPEGWDPIRLKYLLNRIDPGCWGSDFDEKGTIILRSTEIKVDGSWQIDDPATRSITEKERSNCLLKEGDLLVTKSSGSEKHIGKNALVNKDIEKLNCCFSNFMTRLRPNRNQKSKILHYFLNSDNARSQFNYFSNSTVGLGNLNEDCFKNLIFVKIPLDEQVKIRNFLDKKTARIDALIEKDKRLIELLKEKRTALIDHAVTKGLDPNVKLKDSGIVWMGEIPEGWDIDRMKFLVSKINSGITPSGGARVYTDEGVPLLRSQNIHFDGLRLDNVARIPEAVHVTMLNAVVKKHDVLINITGASIGRCTFVEDEFEKANVNQHVCILRPKKVFYKYLSYYLMSRLGQDQVFSVQMGTSREGLNFEQIGNFMIFHPEIEKQKEAVEYLDKATLKIDKTIQK
ncbi:MAG: restriction endonuclease subunit S, partial [Thermoplasmatales archaeon]|nr:restriction endonuclease subunit S [Thermoplasmatales archaeon]